MRTLIQILTITLIICTSNLLQAQCDMDDWIALKAIYESTDGDNWNNNAGWEQIIGTMPPADCDLEIMHGITLEGGRVSSVSLSGNQLSGSLPPEIGNLEFLRRLILYSNELGSLPSEIGNLSFLNDLYLQNTQLISLPPEIGNLEFLRTLHLSNNELSSLPPEIENLNFLTDLYLQNNQFISLPPEIGNLTNLADLYLDDNQLSSLPPEIGNLNSLNVLYLQNNQLSSLPSAIGNLNNLSDLRLYDNQLSSLPSEIGNLNNLTRLYLSENQFSNLPSEIGNLNNLTRLYLSNNQFINLPPVIGNLNNLNLLGLSNNQLSNLPPTIGNLNNLTDLYLANNQFISLPPEIGNLNSLNVLDLDNNLLSGSITLEIGSLNNLTDLDLSYNLFSGNIPPGIGNLNNLTDLNLSHNFLSGCYDENLMSLCDQLSSWSNTNTYISNGNNFDAPWEDFCNTGAGICPVASSDVLPGDCTDNGIVNNKDVLYWALAAGFNGTPRPNATTDCSLQACSDWSQSVNGINSKHQDSDGNGTVNGQDLQVIISNFGCVNDYTAPDYASGTPIYRLQPQGINANGKYQYDLYVENGSGAAAVAHGLAFTLSSDVIPISAITMSTTGSSLNPDEEFAILNGNQCHAALTRTDNFDATCNEPIATFLVKTDDVPVGVPFQIDITAGAKIKADATLDNITSTTAFGMYNGSGANSSNLLLNASVTHEQCNGLGGAIAIPSGGTSPYTYEWSTGANTVQVTNLASGTYTITVTDANGLYQSLTLQINGQTPIYDTNGNLLCGNLCPEYLATSGVTGNGLYSANNTLKSDAIITPGDTAEYKAGQIIELKSGFGVKPDAEFSAEIGDCTGN